METLKKILKKFKIFQKERKMRLFNSLIVLKNVKRGPLGFFNIHPGAKHQKKRGPFEDFRKKFEKKSHKAEKGRGKSHSAKNGRGTLLDFAFQGRGL